jgi:hypothetical protein
MVVIEVPEQFRSKAPKQLRDLAHKPELNLRPVVRQALLDAAAEIEGSEAAYAVLVSDVRGLRERLAHTEANLRSALAQVPRKII